MVYRQTYRIERADTINQVATITSDRREDSNHQSRAVDRSQFRLYLPIPSERKSSCGSYVPDCIQAMLERFQSRQSLLETTYFVHFSFCESKYVLHHFSE